MAPQRRIDVVLDSVKRLLRIGATANLLNLLQKQHPADLAQVFGSLLDTERQAVFSILVERNGRLAMETVSEMGPEEGAKLLTGRSAEEVAKLLQEIPSDDAAALIDYLPEELSAEVLELMRRRESGQVESLLEYGEQTAGRIMNPQVFALSEDLTVGEAITALQSSRDVEMVFYLYVVDARRHLVGVTSLRRLLLVSPETPLKRIMTPEVTSVRVDTDQEEVARLVASYNLLAVPVVDEESKLVGIVTVDDVIDVIKDEATEDLLRLAGVSGDERIATPALEAIRKRLPWLGVNLGDGVPRRLGGLAVRGHDSAGHGARGVHADRGGDGRQRRDADADRDRARPGARGVVVGQRPQGAGEGSRDRTGQRRRAGHRRGRHRLGDQGRSDPGPAARHGDGRQHVRGGDGGHAGAIGAESDEDRSRRWPRRCSSPPSLMSWDLRRSWAWRRYSCVTW